MLVLAGAVGLMRAADLGGGEDQPESPARAAWAKSYAANPLDWNAAWAAAVDRSGVAAAVKWGLAKELLALEAKHGARGLAAFWQEASPALKVSMRAATKAVKEADLVKIDAARTVVLKEIEDAVSTGTAVVTP